METIGIIGTGISAMGAGYLLRDRYDITFFEKNDYPGGHTNTLTVNEDGKDIYIDSGFMVFNEKTYPNIIRLFNELKVDRIETEMSFSVQHIPTGLEWKGTGFKNLFVQKRNLFNWRFLKMLWEVNAFGQKADEIITNPKYQDYTLEQYVKENHFGEDFLYKFMLPMSAAIWSTTPKGILDFPIVTLSRFFKNHGFLGLNTQFQWYTLKGGSRIYRDKLLSHFPEKVHLNAKIVNVKKADGKVEITEASGQKHVFDKVILGCHGDQSLEILDTPTDLEQKLLSKMRYQKNQATLHTDEFSMPKIRKAWASWNYRLDKDETGELSPANVYYMNELQKVSEKKNYFVSIDDRGLIEDKKVLRKINYEHPLFNVEAVSAQKDLPQLNQEGPLYFCGAYFKYGFHEDGFTSGINVAKAIAGEDVW